MQIKIQAPEIIRSLYFYGKTIYVLPFVNHIAIVGEQTFGTGQSLFVRKRELKNTFFKFPVIYNTDVFDADMVLCEQPGNSSNTAGFIDQIHKTFIIYRRGFDTWQCDGIPVVFCLLKEGKQCLFIELSMYPRSCVRRARY